MSASLNPAAPTPGPGGPRSLDEARRSQVLDALVQMWGDCAEYRVRDARSLPPTIGRGFGVPDLAVQRNGQVVHLVEVATATSLGPERSSGRWHALALTARLLDATMWLMVPSHLVDQFRALLAELGLEARVAAYRRASDRTVRFEWY